MISLGNWAGEAIKKLDAEAAQKDAESRVAAIQTKLEAAETARQEAERKLADVQKAQAMANPDATAFKLIFGKVQEDFNELTGYLGKIGNTDDALAGKLRQAVRSLLEKMGEAL